MRNLLLLIVLGVHVSGHSQTQESLVFTLSAGRQSISMDNVNSIIRDSELYSIGQLDTPRENSFTSANKIVGSLGYQLSPSWELGVYSSYQSSLCTHSDGYEFMQNGVLDTIFTNRDYKSRTLSGGLFSRFNIANAIGLNDNPSIFGRTLVGANISLGYLNSSFIATEFFLSLENDEDLLSKRELYRATARGLHLEVSLDLGLRLTDNNLFSAIGIEFGYQYLVSSNLSNRSGDSFLGLDRKAEVDMSGAFINAYLKIGR